jgi:hypothetical protein
VANLTRLNEKKILRLRHYTNIGLCSDHSTAHDEGYFLPLMYDTIWLVVFEHAQEKCGEVVD